MVVPSMSVRIGSGLSTHGDPRVGAVEAAMAARAGLSDGPVDLALVFCSGSHLAAPEATLEGVHEALTPEQLAGCGAGGVLAGDREIESGTAVVVWAAQLGAGVADTFHASVEQDASSMTVTGLPFPEGASGIVLLPDPYDFATDEVLRDLGERAPEVPVIGGLSSARTLDGAGALFHNDRVVEAGAVGVRFEGVELHPCVSQGAAPVGPELTITAAEGHVIHELAGKPAVERLREVMMSLDEHDRRLVATGPLVGIVIDGGKPEYVQGDFLVRGLLGADPDTGAVAVGATVSSGQVVRLHARDAESADRDLRSALHSQRCALGGVAPAGALAFSCNGRGAAMFGSPDHDAAMLTDGLDCAAVAGFFAAGEIGPVGPRSFLHGFTATVAIFAA